MHCWKKSWRFNLPSGLLMGPLICLIKREKSYDNFNWKCMFYCYPMIRSVFVLWVKVMSCNFLEKIRFLLIRSYNLRSCCLSPVLWSSSVILRWNLVSCLIIKSVITVAKTTLTPLSPTNVHKIYFQTYLRCLLHLS